MQKHVFVIHGAGVQRLRRGSVYWKAKLEDALGAGFAVSCPKMPNPARPQYAARRRRIERSLAGLHGPLVLVGHSVVGSVLLKYSPRKSELPQATLRPLDGREHEFHKAELPELVDDIRACLGKPLRETLPEPQPV